MSRSANPVDIVVDLHERAERFRLEAHQILATYETSPSRVMSLDKTRKQLAGLSLRQDDLFRESLRCIELGSHRAAHVMAWAAFIDFLEEKLASDGLVKVKAAKPNWACFPTIEDLRESVPEYQLIEVAREVGLVSKSVMKTLQGHLAKRNECAHPSSYDPGLNESLGYVSELLSRISHLQPKSL